MSATDTCSEVPQSTARGPGESLRKRNWQVESGQSKQDPRTGLRPKDDRKSRQDGGRGLSDETVIPRILLVTRVRTAPSGRGWKVTPAERQQFGYEVVGLELRWQRQRWEAAVGVKDVQGAAEQGSLQGDVK